MSKPSVVLTEHLFLDYVLRNSGVHGRMLSGRFERERGNRINVYGEHGKWLEYFSGDALRSWCILTDAGTPYDGWNSIHTIDVELFAAVAVRQRAASAESEED